LFLLDLVLPSPENPNHPESCIQDPGTAVSGELFFLIAGGLRGDIFDQKEE
jgi:hypothetical protein